jgi:CBS domain containing-hemolysin-like protein
VLRVLRFVFGFVLFAINWIDPVVRRISGADLENGNGHDLSDQVMTVVEDHEQADEVDDVQKEMLEAVFDLPSTDAGEVMTPRTEVDGIDIGSDLDKIKEAILRYGHSRIPVYQDDLDHIVGILYVKDLIRFVGTGEPFDLRSVLREPFMVPESKSVRELLAEFKARKVHLAIVLDEYGGTAGLVTIEDIIEEIVGEIQDEYEVQEAEPAIERVDDSTYEADARVHIEDVSDELDMTLPEDTDYDTLGGFVIASFGRIPQAGETFDFDDLRFTVVDAERTKVSRVRIERMDTASTGGNGA